MEKMQRSDHGSQPPKAGAGGAGESRFDASFDRLTHSFGIEDSREDTTKVRRRGRRQFQTLDTFMLPVNNGFDSFGRVRH